MAYNPQMLAPGQEHYEAYTSRIKRKPQKRVSYDFRAQDGELFSCDRETLGLCRTARDLWERGRSLLEGLR